MQYMANIPKKNVQDMKGMKIDIDIKSFLINLGLPRNSI